MVRPHPNPCHWRIVKEISRLVGKLGEGSLMRTIARVLVAAISAVIFWVDDVANV